METPRNTDPYLDYSIKGLDIADNLSDLETQLNQGEIDQVTFDTQLSEFAKQSLAYLTEGKQRFPDFSVDMEAEIFARALSVERRQVLGLRINELLYASIGDPVRIIDPISNFSRLQQVVDLTAVADRLNDNHFYDQPNRVRELGDAIIGRAVLTLVSFNMDPNTLRIPDRS